MTKTARIEALLEAIRQQGYWTQEQVTEIQAMGRDASYMPEGTEGWMQEDGVPRAYDKPRRFNPGQDVELSLTPKPLDPPPPRPSEAKELAKSGLVTMGADGVAVPVEVDARLKTLEAAMTDVMRRLKALEERVIDPSV
jgi:hypothetical protein